MKFEYGLSAWKPRKEWVVKIIVISIFCGLVHTASFGADKKPGPEGDKKSEEVVYESEISSDSIFSRAWQGGVIVFGVLFILVVFSVMSWAVLFAKYFYLKRISASCELFTKSFWESRSLNELNSRLADHKYSPVKEIFRAGYAELVRGSQLKDQTSSMQMAVNAALENIGRTLRKARNQERRNMEKYLPILATIASSSPFIGLFGTVWGIMGAFEGIARTGSASLAAVAPGISEALIATAFGLAAAIPAVIGYNIANTRIRGLAAGMDSFSSDFLNIVERYLITDRSKAHSTSVDSHL
ncbi:MAG: protein TolQ [Oligoflexales bacterium]|nr:protein TolQ [Oligoflexales bacterium]